MRVLRSVGVSALLILVSALVQGLIPLVELLFSHATARDGGARSSAHHALYALLLLRRHLGKTRLHLRRNRHAGYVRCDIRFPQTRLEWNFGLSTSGNCAKDSCQRQTTGLYTHELFLL